jgi:hypothetical protein
LNHANYRAEWGELFRMVGMVNCALIGFVPSAMAATRPNIPTSHPQRLHFAGGKATLSVRATLKGAQRRTYLLRVGAGQHLKIKVLPTNKNWKAALVPLVFVTPPGGKYDGDKTVYYVTDSTRAGDYKIEVGANLMASNANSGAFELNIAAK